jgi:hypothetical protein
MCVTAGGGRSSGFSKTEKVTLWWLKVTEKSTERDVNFPRVRAGIATHGFGDSEAPLRSLLLLVLRFQDGNSKCGNGSFKYLVPSFRPTPQV